VITHLIGVRFAGHTPGHEQYMFFFFSNRLGLAGSILLSLLITGLLLLIFLA
jgi:hypothetical protein